jgi:hypothetical protein
MAILQARPPRTARRANDEALENEDEGRPLRSAGERNAA